MGIDLLTWRGVSGETGKSFRQHCIPTGSGRVHAYRRDGTARRRLRIPAGQHQFTRLGQQDNGYGSMTSHCWTGRQNRLMRIQLRTCCMKPKLLPTVANRQLQLSSGMLYKRRGSIFRACPELGRKCSATSGRNQEGERREHSILRNW